MYEKLFEQSERVFKPFGEIWALQAEAAETIAKKQTSVLTDAWNQGVLALQNLPGQKSVEDVFRLQQAYWTNMQDSWQELFGNAQNIVLETNRKISAVLQKSTDSVDKTWVKAAASTPIKPSSSSATKAAISVKKAVTPTKPSVAPAKNPVPTKNSVKAASNLAVKASASSKAADSSRPIAKPESKVAKPEPKAAKPESKIAKPQSKDDGKKEAHKGDGDKSSPQSDLLV
jgi:hypothetical protein